MARIVSKLMTLKEPIAIFRSFAVFRTSHNVASIKYPLFNSARMSA